MALVTQKLSIGTAYPMVVASMGASAVILFILPNSPLAQPWSFFGGQLISAIVGVACAQWIADIALASACAVGGSIFAMLLLRCLHPPGAATAITPILTGDPINAVGYAFVLTPVGLNVLVMLVMAIAINRWLLRRDYPIVSGNKNTAVEPARQTGISDQDLKEICVNCLPMRRREALNVLKARSPARTLWSGMCRLLNTGRKLKRPGTLCISKNSKPCRLSIEPGE
jgi:CBS domain-containing membrane protein